VSVHIETENAELVTVRTAMRGLNALVDDLEEGRREKVVLTAKGKMRAVVLSVEEYARLRAEEYR
jgi:PHD/YefM family antitoxin component YafN of YafNO toxin-antitoxin module